MTSPAHPLDADTARALLTDMVRIRRFEERCVELYSGAEIRGFVHRYGFPGWPRRRASH